MKQTTALLSTLKRYLKAKGITYNELAREMGLSEASIKRLFSKNTLTVERLEAICKVLGIDFFELALMLKNDSDLRSPILTIHQEQVLSDNPKLMIFFYFLINGWSLETIRKDYEIEETELTELLIQLDRLGLIELHPNNRIKRLIFKNIFWRKDGPLWYKYRGIIQNEFLEYLFDRPTDRLVFSIGQLSEASIKTLLKKFDELVKQYNEMAEMDAVLPIHRRRSVAFSVAFRNWVLPGIGEFWKRKR